MIAEAAAMNNILITGGTGFFGQGFVRRMLSMGPERICIFSRSEWMQAQMRIALNNDSRLRWFIGDVRDVDRLRRAMDGVDLVIHAAALKRIETVEYNVIEAVATNVVGTRNVVDAAIDAGIKKAVLLSTDKACLPTTTYGMTKAIAERIFLQSSHYAGPGGPKFAACRYGNVAGSTGSVIPLWRSLLATGENRVPVTDPDCSRFWMTLDQAIDLVWKTATTMQGGELNIPDLPAYRLGDLAKAMGAEMRVVGMAPAEKRHEEMKPGETSDKARRLTVTELQSLLEAA